VAYINNKISLLTNRVAAAQTQTDSSSVTAVKKAYLLCLSAVCSVSVLCCLLTAFSAAVSVCKYMSLLCVCFCGGKNKITILIINYVIILKLKYIFLPLGVGSMRLLTCQQRRKIQNLR
jgi:hypothetical protein